MPIKVTDFTWTETDEAVHVVVPLKGAKAAKADIYSTDLYIKVNFPPFIFEADLFKDIDHEASSATVGKGAIDFKLKKREATKWGRLTAIGEKDDLIARRAVAQERSFEQQKEAAETKTREIRSMQKAAVQKQMDIDKAARRELEEVKEAERQQANKDIAVLAGSDKSANSTPNLASKSKSKVKSTQSSTTIAQAIPIRSTGEIAVTFTKRAFPTAARESHAVEEEEWLAKQSAARKAVQEAKDKAKNNDIEADPLWYKDRGNEFFKQNNFQAAINAFTAAISLDENMASLYSNRAACHIAQKDFYAGANDCSKALTLLTPPVEANKRSRLIARSRRAGALAAVGDYDSALGDLREALILDPENLELTNDLRTVMSKVNGA
eukprot:m.266086 g.266086  ORF g.266086 m.266086 type:complete len:381 (-) comp65354_c0_seq1:279-1421(-)